VNAFEILYLCFGSFVAIAGVAMIGTYSATYPWWRNHVGRMMVTYAGAEVLMSLLLLFTVVGHVSPMWFRAVWFILQTAVGCAFCFQTVLLVRLYRQRRERATETTREESTA
jgi:hypothetical protein